MTYQEACRAIVVSPNVDPYARAYADTGLNMTGDAARVQALYILCNLSHWRAPEAKAVRETLKRVGEVK